MPAGRPTDYSNEILEKAQEYLGECEDEEVQLVKLVNDEKGYTSYENKLKVKLPSIEGLARHLNVARSTLYEWAKEYEEFSDILKDIKLEQAHRLINNGLSGDYNSTITKLILTKHGYSDKTELMGKDGKDLFPVPILNNMNVPSNNGDSTDKPAQEEDSGDTGRDLGE